MAFTKNGIYYNDDYNSVADVLLDSQKMAESIDEQMEIQIKETEKAMKKIQNKIIVYRKCKKN